MSWAELGNKDVDADVDVVDNNDIDVIAEIFLLMLMRMLIIMMLIMMLIMMMMTH